MAQSTGDTFTVPRGLSWRQFKAILRKDIAMELRTKEMILSMGMYAVLTMVVYWIALSQAGSAFDPSIIAAGLLWLAFIFTSMLGLNRSLVHEQDQGTQAAEVADQLDKRGDAPSPAHIGI